MDNAVVDLVVVDTVVVDTVVVDLVAVDTVVVNTVVVLTVVVDTVVVDPVVVDLVVVDTVVVDPVVVDLVAVDTVVVDTCNVVYMMSHGAFSFCGMLTELFPTFTGHQSSDHTCPRQQQPRTRQAGGDQEGYLAAVALQQAGLQPAHVAELAAKTAPNTPAVRVRPVSLGQAEPVKRLTAHIAEQHLDTTDVTITAPRSERNIVNMVPRTIRTHV